ncbi:MAG TPA: MlaD family protein [Methylomirabilota bacterium]|jgi:phospholipid/cholesterol/gamma-HCH transport system substrate-binding protein|nr:MlaD family protein [Methylomirabilota bacterium]
MADRSQVALQVRIGGFILAGLGVFLAIIYLLGAQARYFERKYDLIADFTEVGGLIEGATVRLAGVQIGRVTRVELPPQAGGKVRVTLTIAKRFSERIRKDSEARIVTQGLLGDKLVEISIGNLASPPLRPGEHLVAQEPFEMGRVFAEATDTLQSIKRLTVTLNTAVEAVERGGTLDRINRLATALGSAVERMERAGTLDDLGAAAKSARRITDQVEKGSGLLHALIYEEPETLRRLNALLQSSQDLLAQAQRGDNAVTVLLSPESGKAARSLIAAMDAIGRSAEKPGAADGLLPALLFDPQYRGVAEDLQAVARNFRDVSEKVAHGQGFLGELVQGGDGTPLGRASVDFRAAMANLLVITERLKAGEGTLGALLQDSSVYESLAQFLQGSQRSFLLRALIRSALGGGAKGADGK